MVLNDKFEEKDYYSIVVITFILVWSFIEPCIIDVGRNIFVILLIPLLEMGNIEWLSYKKLSSGFFKKNEDIES